jgi:pimeloyl-ACP methyl ester carboxylesterase
MPHPIIGVGHSVGNCHTTQLALLHPRLLHALVIVDPVLQVDLKINKTMARLSMSRRDVWPTRAAAAASFRKSGFYRAWDPRVLEKWIEFGLRELPTELYPDVDVVRREEGTGSSKAGNGDGDVPVTLTTTVAQEVHYYVRASYRDRRLLQEGGSDEDLLRDVHPDDRAGSAVFVRPELQRFIRTLPELEPSVLYIWGGKSDASTPASRAKSVQATGTGVGGSGGVQAGRVREVVLECCGHLVGMERPAECAEATAGFVDAEVRRWEARERAWDEALEGLGRRKRVGINDLWREKIGAVGKSKSRL